MFLLWRWLTKYRIALLQPRLTSIRLTHPNNACHQVESPSPAIINQLPRGRAKRAKTRRKLTILATCMNSAGPTTLSATARFRDFYHGTLCAYVMRCPATTTRRIDAINKRAASHHQGSVLQGSTPRLDLQVRAKAAIRCAYPRVLIPLSSVSWSYLVSIASPPRPTSRIHDNALRESSSLDSIFHFSASSSSCPASEPSPHSTAPLHHGRL